MPSESKPTGPGRYHAYGLRFASDIALPELHAGSDGKADVVVRRGAVPTDGPGDDRYRHLGDRDAVLLRAGLAAVRVRDGREIVVDAAPDADGDALRLLILGPALGLLLHQRGCFVLHANAVRVGERAYVLCGASGEGKSTLSAAVVARGGVLVSDDVTALVPTETGYAALPGLGRLKLWPDAVAATGGDVTALRPLTAATVKRDVPVGVAGDAVPVGRVLVLAPGAAPALTPLAPQDALREILGAAYVGRVLGDADRAPHFRHAARLVGVAEVARLGTGDRLDRLGAVVTLLEDG